MPLAELSLSVPARSTLARFRADPIAFLRDAAAQHGPLAPFRIAGREFVLVSGPDSIEELLVIRQTSFRKGPGLLRTRPLLGDGLLTADGACHRSQRRRLQPAFHPNRIADSMEEMARQAGATASSWRSGETRDIHREMMRLTLAIVVKTLFAGETIPDPDGVADSVAEALHTLYAPLSACPHPRADPDRAVKSLGNALQTVIDGHCPASRAGDLLSLLQAEDLTPTERRDEAMTFLLAGHESVANALSWTWYALSQDAAVRRRFESEIDTAADQTPNPMALPYTRQVIAESLRLYPPAWMVSREAMEDVPIGSRSWPARTIFVAAPCVTHVEPNHWPDALRFDPDRWADPANDTRPRFAYFPFGGGARRCIGDQFALTEMAAVLCVIGRRWRLDPIPGDPPRPEPLVTLRPAGGMKMTLTAR